MHSAIFVASIPKEHGNWETFLMYAENELKMKKGVLRLAENIWLLNFEETLTALGLLIAAADSQKVSYGLLPFEHAPEWLPGGFDPNTIQGRIYR